MLSGVLSLSQHCNITTPQHNNIPNPRKTCYQELKVAHNIATLQHYNITTLHPLKDMLKGV